MKISGNGSGLHMLGIENTDNMGIENILNLIFESAILMSAYGAAAVRRKITYG